MRRTPFLNLVLALALAIMIVWVLAIARPILLPIVMAVISVYVLVTASDALGRLPVLGRMSGMARHALVLLAFTLAIAALLLVISSTMSQLIRVMPTYQDNIEALIARFADKLNFDETPTWADLKTSTLDRVNLQSLLVSMLGGVAGVGLTLFLVIVYSGFLLGERRGFVAKLAAAFPDQGQAERTARIIGEINRKIGDYLAVKTLMNMILGVISFVILWAMGVDFALFWAVVIGLTNYIPYVGSIVGVALPVILSVAQFGSLGTTALLGTLLIGAQTYVGNVLEPRMIGRHLNLSPFVILVALSVWSSVWGLAGAILAIPMTSVVAIICGSFASTRFVAVLLSDTVDPAPEPVPTKRDRRKAP